MDSTFTAPEIPDSELPALLGGRSLENLKVLLGCANNCMYLVGPGGYELRLSPGSRKLNLERSSGGHWMLPCSQFDPKPHQRNVFTETQTFVVGPHLGAGGNSELIQETF